METKEQENDYPNESAASASSAAPGADASSAGACDRASEAGHDDGKPGDHAHLRVEVSTDEIAPGGIGRRAVTPEERARILTLHHAEGWPVGTISAHLHRHHDTVENVLAESGLVVTKQSTRKRQVDLYVPFMQETLAKYPRLTASRLWGMVKARGYTGSKSGFRAIVKRLRPRRAPEAFLRRAVLPGHEAQVDWAHFGTITIGRARRYLFAFVMVLSYSRLRLVRFAARAAMPSFLRGHVEAFRFFGAVPRVILYDNLKSAVLEREGDAVRFHPTLLELAGHYRFEPRPCAPYRPNEKGRVERAIRDVREGFFAARTFTSLDDLNAQARAWCVEISGERRVPDAKDRTVADAFLEERPKMIELPEDEFPAEERVDVRVGKTQYVRFDMNDYSVPHIHVQRRLTVIAGEERVRVVDPERPTIVLAEHVRSYDRDQRVENAEHLATLVEEKRRAHQSRGFDRLFAAVPSARAMIERLAERGANLGATTSGLLQILDRVGADWLERAVAEVVARDQLKLRAVHHELDRLRYEAGMGPALTVPVTTSQEANAQVRPHALSTYDRLLGGKNGGDHGEG